ncbi:MAG: deoxyuridine 5'-triphosphate nucleotidohydrolase [Chloroflexi bacterium]|nr:deoxyuridine 5'-triphosphate nucleotidohydrolase [Chloroflexota bacterium]
MLTGGDIARRRIVAPDAELVDEQVQPNGVDLTLDALWMLRGAGRLGRVADDRLLPEREPVTPLPDDWFELGHGDYVLRFAEVVSVPLDCGGLVFPRSSLLRMGAHVPTAVWDAGYRGRGESLLQVVNPAGLRVQRGSRIAQLVLFPLTEQTRGYQGRYQEDC